MAKFLLKIKARELRKKKGMSIKTIAQKLSVSKGTVSLWCRDIELTPKQIKKLLNNMKEGMKRGQIIVASMRKKERLDKVDKYNKEGVKRFKSLSQKELFVAGIALYLAEGSKKEKFLKFVNSDPEVIEFMISWFKKIFEVPIDRFKFAIFINEIHREREEEVKGFWVKRLKISPDSFRKTIFVKSKQKKVYENYNNYYGTIHFSILKSTELLYKMLGLTRGLLKTKNMSQGSSAGKSAALIKRRSRVQISPLTLNADVV